MCTRTPTATPAPPMQPPAALEQTAPKSAGGKNKAAKARRNGLDAYKANSGTGQNVGLGSIPTKKVLGGI